MNFNVCVLIAFLNVAAGENFQCTDGNCNFANTTEVLSRSKRYLVFPEGSSFQLVICLQTAAVTIGQIILYGNTAALAWNLPTDPKFLLMFKEYQKKAESRKDEKNIYYLNENGKIIAKRPFTRPLIVNPVFAKRSVEDETFRNRLKAKIDRIKMHARHDRDFLKHTESTTFHRDSRVELYNKLETLITTLGADGRQCVLRKLCEAARVTTPPPTFLQQLVRVVFTFPKDKESSDEEYREYDEAHNSENDCEAMYPGCDEFNPDLF